MGASVSGVWGVQLRGSKGEAARASATLGGQSCNSVGPQLAASAWWTRIFQATPTHLMMRAALLVQQWEVSVRWSVASVLQSAASVLQLAASAHAWGARCQVANGRWSQGNGRWSQGNGRWSLANDLWSLANGPSLVVNDHSRTGPLTATMIPMVALT